MTTRLEVQCLILVDLQRALVEGDSAVPSARTLLAAVNQQLASARAAGAMVIHLQNDGAEGAPDAPGEWGWEMAITPAADEPVVRKQKDDGFDGTDLALLLSERSVSSLSVCGVMSEMCVAATAREALQLGHDVVLAHDSHATYDVPALLPGEADVPASLAARAAEWSLGDTIVIAEGASEVRFVPTPGAEGCVTS